MRQYPVYDNSGIEYLAEIPQHWEVWKLKYLVKEKLKYGANEAAELEDRSLPRYIRITDFDDSGKLKEDTFKSLPYNIAKEYLLKNGDLLFARSGATVGKTLLFDNYNGIACFAGYLIKASCDERKMNYKFLDYYTYSSAYENWKDMIFIQATIQNIGADKYNVMLVPKPPIKEQQLIVKYLDFKTNLIDGFIANRRKQIELLKEQLRKKIYTALTKGLTNQDFKSSDLPWFTGIPVNWEIYKFNAAIKLLHGFQFRDNHFKEQGVKVAKITQLKADGSLDLSEASFVDETFLITLKKKIIKNGDILMALTGGTIGKIIRVENLEQEVLQNYRVGKFVPKDTRKLDKDFMFWVLSSEFTFAQILFLQRETGQPNIGIGDFSKMFFPMPDTLEEQRKIVEYIVEQKGETSTLILKYQHQIDLMKEYRTSIISQAVTGKIDARDWQPKTKNN